MKVPKTVKRYCPYCKKHTEQKVSQAKKKNPSPLNKGSKFRAKKRGLGRGAGNLGKYGSKPAISKFKMTGKKTSKKTDLRYQCTVCKKLRTQRSGTRAKKVELV